MKIKLGSTKDAKLIYSYHRHGKVPDGWRLLDGGTYRHVYKSPDGFVYKINRREDPHDDQNASEINTYEQLKKTKIEHQGWRIAAVKGHVLTIGKKKVQINCMEYIDGEHDDEDDYNIATNVDSIFQTIGLYDGHVGNYISTKTGEKVIIDLGG